MIQQAPGWAFRSVSPVATGTTSLSITAPSGVVDTDILVMVLGHKGAGWATVPAGWTLVVQEISGATRGEMYWKRAASEGASYSVTDLATAAAGAIGAWSGGLFVGDVVRASIARANAGGASGTGSFNVDAAHALIIMATALGTNAALTSVGTVFGGRFVDHDLRSLRERVDAGTTGIRVLFGDGIKIVPGETGAWGYGTPSVENVGMAAAFLPQPTHDVSGTRYYLHIRPPGKRIVGRLQGGWDSTRDDSRGWRQETRTYMLSRLKAGAGAVIDQNTFTNQQANFDLCLARFMSPPLAAQSIGGTLDLTWTIAQYWSDLALGIVDLSTVRTKVHVYITKGQTAEVRHTLLRRHIEPTGWPFSAATRTSFAVPAALTTGLAEHGDCLMIELGARVVSSPAPAPHYPPDEWTALTITGFGACTTTAQGVHSGVPLQDSAVSYFDFSDVLLELTDDELEAITPAPTHVTPAAARVIEELPYTEAGVDTTRSPALSRAVWHRWTADEDRRMLAVSFGTTHGVLIEVFTGPDADTLSVVTLVSEATSTSMAPHRAMHTAWFDAVEGETYWIRTRNLIITGLQGAGAGGWTRLGLFARRAPKLDDIYVPTSRIVAFDGCGHPVNLQSDFNASNPLALAIDYSGRPMADFNAPPGTDHEAERLLVGLHDSTLVEVLDLETLNVGQMEIDWFGDAWDGEGANPDSKHVASLALDSQGRLLAGWFGDGYQHIAGPPPLPSYLNQPSEDPATSAVRRIDATASDGQASATTAETFAVPVEVAAPHHIALDPADDDTLYYTSGAWYRPASQVGSATADIRAAEIRRFALGAGDALATFATLPLDTSPASGLRGLQVLPGGHGVIVGNGNRVDWVNAEGAIVRSFRPWPGHLCSFADVKLTADGRQLVAWDDAEARLYRWELLTAALVRVVETYLPPGQGSGIALYQPNGIELCW